jgi:deoxyribodipyrimidine photo-lyase
MARSIFWFRRDLRLSDNPALSAAIANSDEVLPLFIMDEEVWKKAGSHRNAYLTQSLTALNESLGGKLAVVSGEPIEILSNLLKKYGADTVHAAFDYAPYGMSRDAKVKAAGINLEQLGSYYAVAPGRVKKPDGTNYRVYTPFYKAWSAHGWRKPISAPKELNLISPLKVHQEKWSAEAPAGVTLQAAGEAAALDRWVKFRKSALADYQERRNYPGEAGVSRMSPHLRWGEIHPRTLLDGLSSEPGPETFRKEIAWREFYADILFNYPNTSREYYSPNFAKMRYDEPGEKFIAWCEGKTGYPIVDAGMRQLRAEGWMHNRVRMIVASFLVKDLHLEWQHGAQYFMKYLIDNDVASNSHGWQWTAGCGTDASPYYRVFNPTEQGKKFDPNGDYIKKYIPELSHLSSNEIHQPELANDGLKFGYPAPIVDHAKERKESLARLEEIKEVKPEYHPKPRAI